jgi:hypothetical protein
MLYRSLNNYELSWGPPRSRVRHAERLNSSLFLRTVCTNPEFGLAVRSLSTESWKSVEAMHPRELLKLLQGDATLAALFRWKTRGFWLDGGDAFSEMSGDPSPRDGTTTSAHGGAIIAVSKDRRAEHHHSLPFRYLYDCSTAGHCAFREISEGDTSKSHI